jgi:hypothetical protein
MIDEDIWKSGVKKITKEIKRAIEKTPDVSYIGLVGRDSRNHPVHLLEFIIDGETKRKEIASSGTGGRYALQDFMKKVKRVFQGRDGFSGANIKLKGDIEIEGNWFNILKMKIVKPQCANKPCLRVANGTDGYGFCMACEDDASENRLTDTKSPYTRKNQIKRPTLPNIYEE